MEIPHCSAASAVSKKLLIISLCFKKDSSVKGFMFGFKTWLQLITIFIINELTTTDLLIVQNKNGKCPSRVPRVRDDFFKCLVLCH